MKGIGRLLTFLFVLVCGCAHYSKMVAPAPPDLKERFEVLSHVNETASGFRLFMLGTSAPSAMEMIHQAVEKSGGDGMVNVEVSFSEMFIGPFSLPQVTVEGDVVKCLARAAFDTGLEKTVLAANKRQETGSPVFTSSTKDEPAGAEAVPALAPAPANAPHMAKPAPALSAWKHELAGLYKKHAIYSKWWSYLRRTKQNMKFEHWVGKLGESEYHDYAQMGLHSAEWLLTRWEKEAQAFENKRAQEMNVPSPF